MFGIKRPPIRFNIFVGIVFVAVILAWFLLYRFGFPPASSNHPVPAARSARLADTITIMSYNVENLFDLVDDGTEYPEFKPNHCNWNDFTFGVRVQNLATVIASANPAIAVLYEVENQRALEALRSALAQKGKDFKYTALGDRPNATNTCPAILSKYPIIFAAGIPTIAIDNHFSRNILEAHILLGQDSLVVFANHWPSKKFAESYRVAVADLLAARIKQLDPGIDYLIAGDFNEDYNECEVFYSEGMDDSHGVTGINHSLGTVSSQPYASIRFSEPGEKSSASLSHYDPWIELPQAARGSHSFQGQWATIDHLLMPPALFDTTGVSYVPNSFTVFTMHDSLLRNGIPFGWQVSYGGPCPYHKGEGFSDHLPIMARFCCAPFPTRPIAAVGDESPALADMSARSFETGYEGWVGEASGLHLVRDTAMAHRGRFSLNIAGTVRNENATVARLVVPSALLAGRSVRELSMYLKGAGELCFRARSEGDHRWIYFVGSEHKQAHAAKYADLNFLQWTKIALPVAGIVDPGHGLEFEVRSAKKKAIGIWVDDVALAYAVK